MQKCNQFKKSLIRVVLSKKLLNTEVKKMKRKRLKNILHQMNLKEIQLQPIISYTLREDPQIKKLMRRKAKTILQKQDVSLVVVTKLLLKARLLLSLPVQNHKSNIILPMEKRNSHTAVVSELASWHRVATQKEKEVI